MSRAALTLAALLVALPLSLLARQALRLNEVPGARERRARLLATRDSTRAELRARELSWGSELEMTWRPRLQAGGAPDSVGPEFIIVAIGGGGSAPAQLPVELRRWTNPAEAAPPDRVGNWLATRVTNSSSRRWLLARALRPGYAAEVTRVSRELSELTDARLAGGALVLSYAGPYLVAALVSLGAALGVGRALSPSGRRAP